VFQVAEINDTNNLYRSRFCHIDLGTFELSVLSFLSPINGTGFGIHR